MKNNDARKGIVLISVGGLMTILGLTAIEGNKTLEISLVSLGVLFTLYGVVLLQNSKKRKEDKE